jgi:GNAT superfamily N-acetyltransferase
MELAIRRGHVADAVSISAFLTPLADRFIAYEFAPDARRNFLETFSTAAIEDYLRGGFRYHIAETREGIAGVVAIRDNCHLYHLFVAESAHRSGIGRRLWEVARDDALDTGATSR